MLPLRKRNVLQDLASRAKEGDQAALHQLQRCLDLSLTRIVRRALRTSVPQSVLIERIQAMVCDFVDLNKHQIAVQGEILTDRIAQRLLENVLRHLHVSASTVDIVRNAVCADRDTDTISVLAITLAWSHSHQHSGDPHPGYSCW